MPNWVSSLPPGASTKNFWVAGDQARMLVATTQLEVLRAQVALNFEVRPFPNVQLSSPGRLTALGHPKLTEILKTLADTGI